MYLKLFNLLHQCFSITQDAIDPAVHVSPIQYATAAIFHVLVTFLLVWLFRIFLITFIILLFIG